MASLYPYPRLPEGQEGSDKGRSSPATDSVCKVRGRIHRGLLRRDYYGIHVHERELQRSIPTTGWFRDFRLLSELEPSGQPYVARVRPRGIRGILTSLSSTFLRLGAGSPPRVPSRTGGN